MYLVPCVTKCFSCSAPLISFRMAADGKPSATIRIVHSHTTYCWWVIPIFAFINYTLISDLMAAAEMVANSSLCFSLRDDGCFVCRPATDVFHHKRRNKQKNEQSTCICAAAFAALSSAIGHGLAAYDKHFQPHSYQNGPAECCDFGVAD